MKKLKVKCLSDIQSHEHSGAGCLEVAQIDSMELHVIKSFTKNQELTIHFKLII